MRKEKIVVPQDQIIDMYERGFSCKDICLAFDMTVIKVRGVLRDAGYDTRTYRKVSESNRKKVILLIKAGYSYKQIEGLLHVSTHLIREIVEHAELVGFAPNNHPPIELKVKVEEISLTSVNELKGLYLTGNYGLAKCADLLHVSDKELLWFVFYLTDEDVKKHNDRLKENIFKMNDHKMPVTAIAKNMDISLSIIKKLLRKRAL